MTENQGWRKVSYYGQPTEETCPHGYWWRRLSTGTEPRPVTATSSSGWVGDVEWQPLPAPVDEEMPPPEPEPRWRFVRWDGPNAEVTFRLSAAETDGEGIHAFGEHRADILNAHDRGDVVWPERLRPMSELPDDGRRVLIVYRDGSMAARYGHESNPGPNRRGWLPLPDAETAARYLGGES